MNDQLACPRCGATMPADSPQGVCPKCVIGLGLGTAGQPGGVADTTDHRGRFVPPKPDQLAPHFPQLEILDLIGQGGMGAVYKARQRGLDRLVGLKILPPDAERDPTFSQRFSREARALARLNHPHIVSVYDSGQAGGLYYFIMEYVAGINLREAIRTGELGPKEALAIVPQVCDALEYAHDEGIVHRDIKPENVLLDKKGRVKIADFGLARLLGQTADSFTLTGTHQVMGTPKYMAPEQMEGSHEVDHRADIYSLGVVFYEMLTGELPLGRFEPPSRKVRIDVRLDEVVLRTLEKEPARRYQRVSELKSDVESISGLDRMPPHLRRAYGYEYRSKAEIFGWPLVNVATGIDPQTGRKRVARGIIAVGDIAVGLLATGGIAVGGVVCGGVAGGLISLGGLSVGLLVAIGGGAIGMGFSLGGLAVGSVAMGGLAVGVFAYGGQGGEVYGVFGQGANVQDPAAMRLFGNWAPTLTRWFPLLVLPCLLLVGLLTWLATAVAAGKARTELPKAPQDSRLRTAGRHRHSSGCAVVMGCLFMLLVAPCLIGAIVLPPSYLLLSRDQPDSTSAPAVKVTAPEGRVEVAPPAVHPVYERKFHWELDSTGPVITERFARSLRLSAEQEEQANAILQSVYADYLQRERENLDQSTDAAGHQVSVVRDFSAEVELLEHQLWIQLDQLLDVDQQRVARSNLELFPIEARAGVSLSELLRPGLLGWGKEGATIEIWRVGSWYHWRVSRGRYRRASSAPELPLQLQHYWRGEEM